ncbi:hypothetical protein B0H13DRAFT_881186 [Mycena leptocephala]|nr:hypothetical protein B0H13DRAFT_881186 [Mycena leptocephala]
MNHIPSTCPAKSETSVCLPAMRYPILEAKNPYTNSPSIACRPFRLYVMNRCHVVPRRRSVLPLAPSVSHWLRAHAAITMDLERSELLARLDAWVRARGSTRACQCVPFRVSLCLFSFISNGGSSSRVRASRREARGRGRAGMRTLVCGGWRLHAYLRAGARDVCADTSARGASLRRRRRTGTAAGCMHGAPLSFPFCCVPSMQRPARKVGWLWCR